MYKFKQLEPEIEDALNAIDPPIFPEGGTMIDGFISLDIYDDTHQQGSHSLLPLVAVASKTTGEVKLFPVRKLLPKLKLKN